MPDQVLIWLGELYKIIDCPNECFIEEFEEFSSIFHESELQTHSLKLKRSISKLFKVDGMLDSLTIICVPLRRRLFARAVALKILHQSFETETTWERKMRKTCQEE